MSLFLHTLSFENNSEEKVNLILKALFFSYLECYDDSDVLDYDFAIIEMNVHNRTRKSV